MKRVFSFSIVIIILASLLSLCLLTVSADDMTLDGQYRWNDVVFTPSGSDYDSTSTTYRYTVSFTYEYDGAPIQVNYIEMVSDQYDNWIYYVQNGSPVYSYSNRNLTGGWNYPDVHQVITFDNYTFTNEEAYLWIVRNTTKINPPLDFVSSITLGFNSLLGWSGEFLGSLLIDGGSLYVLVPLVGLGAAFTVVKFGIRIIKTFAFGF